MGQEFVSVFDPIDDSLAKKKSNVEECGATDGETVLAVPGDASVIGDQPV